MFSTVCIVYEYTENTPAFQADLVKRASHTCMQRLCVMQTYSGDKKKCGNKYKIWFYNYNWIICNPFVSIYIAILIIINRTWTSLDIFFLLSFDQNEKFDSKVSITKHMSTLC